MKKFITLLLVLTGMVSTASADYYVFVNEGSWNLQTNCTLTDADGDGVYSVIINFKTEDKLSWGQYHFVLSKANTLGDGWSNVIWTNFPDKDANASVFSEDDFTLSDSYVGDGKLYVPITESTPKTYAVKFEYTPSTHKFKATKMIGLKSNMDSWVNYDYLPETTHNSKIFQRKFEMPDDTEFKFLLNDNSSEAWFGKDGDKLSTSGSNITVDADGVYTITANLTEGYPYVAPSLVKETATISAVGMATFSSEYALDFTDVTTLKAYRATSASEGKVMMTRVMGKVKANTGLFLDGASAEIPTTIYSTEAESLLKPTDGTDIYDAGKNRYVFANQGDNPAFYKVTGSLVLAAGKAYLETASPLASARLAFEFDDEETTGIDVIMKDNLADGEYFNLAGQRVAQPSKGLYIVNGKKVIIK